MSGSHPPIDLLEGIQSGLDRLTEAMKRDNDKIQQVCRGNHYTIYEGSYEDARGRFPAKFENDGRMLRLKVLDVVFESADFDLLSVVSARGPLDGFSFYQDDLCSCALHVGLEVVVRSGDEDTVSLLEVEVALPPWDEGINYERFRLTLRHHMGVFQSSGKEDTFETALQQLSRQFPSGTRIRSCLFCQYGDYNPGGNPSFGGMMCFRNIKEEYNRVRGKGDFWGIARRCDRYVQETFLCSEFEDRIPGSGYRG